MNYLKSTNYLFWKPNIAEISEFIQTTSFMSLHLLTTSLTSFIILLFFFIKPMQRKEKLNIFGYWLIYFFINSIIAISFISLMNKFSAIKLTEEFLLDYKLLLKAFLILFSALCISIRFDLYTDNESIFLMIFSVFSIYFSYFCVSKAINTAFEKQSRYFVLLIICIIFYILFNSVIFFKFRENQLNNLITNKDNHINKLNELLEFVKNDSNNTTGFSNDERNTLMKHINSMKSHIGDMNKRLCFKQSFFYYSYRKIFSYLKLWETPNLTYLESEQQLFSEITSIHEKYFKYFKFNSIDKKIYEKSEKLDEQFQNFLREMSKITIFLEDGIKRSTFNVETLNDTIKKLKTPFNSFNVENSITDVKDYAEILKKKIFEVNQDSIKRFGNGNTLSESEILEYESNKLLFNAGCWNLFIPNTIDKDLLTTSTNFENFYSKNFEKFQNASNDFMNYDLDKFKTLSINFRKDRELLFILSKLIENQMKLIKEIENQLNNVMSQINPTGSTAGELFIKFSDIVKIRSDSNSSSAQTIDYNGIINDNFELSIQNIRPSYLAFNFRLFELLKINHLEIYTILKNLNKKASLIKVEI